MPQIGVGTHPEGSWGYSDPSATPFASKCSYSHALGLRLQIFKSLEWREKVEDMCRFMWEKAPIWLEILAIFPLLRTVEGWKKSIPPNDVCVLKWATGGGMLLSVSTSLESRSRLATGYGILAYTMDRQNPTLEPFSHETRR
ncbi:hypothetical protein Ddc_11088 [Ditylenchus destructor]|nr:hypothetical protein Ddc_11088 [Ditylenchus destructor]